MNPRSLLIVCLLGACGVTSDADDVCQDGKCDGPDNSCSDQRYDDGVCDPQIDCAVPDIDCFETFEDDASAATWFAAFEAKLAEEEHRPPRTFLTPDHPRWASTRQLLDDGWETFRKTRPVGLLGDKRPALVLIDDPTPNAFVAPDLETGKAGFVVMVQTGLFATGGSDEGGFGIMMHEFQHVVGLHIVGDTKQRMRTFYFASDTVEPIGTNEVDDASARAHGELWRLLAGEAGRFREERLRALPMGGQLATILQAAIAQAGGMQVPACVQARTALSAIANGIASQMDPLSGEITVTADVPATVDQAMATLDTACFEGQSRDLIDVIAQINGQTTEAAEAAMQPSDVALVKGVSVVDGFSALLLDRRSKLRQVEAELIANTGHPWRSLRYFSTEEDADDVSVRVLRAANVEPPYAVGDFLVSFLDADGKARCNDLLARGVVPPYGADLVDEHHGTCWRAHHARQFSELPDRARNTNFTHVPTLQHRPLPIARPLRDRLAY